MLRWFRLPRALLLAAAVVVSAAVPTASGAATSGAALAGVATRDVEFEVVNRNGTPLPCSTDGETYRLAGTLVAPAPAARGRSAGAVTVYAHDIALGGFFFAFPQGDLHHAHHMARQGHASVVLDRLGYDASPRPAGTATCLGAQADMLDQVVAQLRAGDYTASGGRPAPVFDRIVLAGHSVGAGIAELTTTTFGGVDGLIEMSWADTGASPRAIDEARIATTICLTGGEPSEDDGSPGYAFYGQSEQDFREIFFASADPAVVQLATSLRNRDPCGDTQTLAPLVAVNTARAALVDVPVLLLFGDRDALNRPDAAQQQQALLVGSPEVDLVTVPDAGNALLLERSAPSTRSTLAAWLCEHDLGGRCAATGPPAAAPSATPPSPAAVRLPATG